MKKEDNGLYKDFYFFRNPKNNPSGMDSLNYTDSARLSLFTFVKKNFECSDSKFIILKKLY